jgi:protein involved in polysaccharide export with SLBB domain
VRLREGDSVRIAFPGSPNLDSVQLVRRDGKVTVTLGGEAMAMGKTSGRTGEGNPQSIRSPVGGQTSGRDHDRVGLSRVCDRGRVASRKDRCERPMSALEAVMEAGGFDFAKANLKSVMVLRQAEGQVINYKLNFQEILKGPKSEPFYLKPSDVVYVPEKFSWF